MKQKKLNKNYYLKKFISGIALLGSVSLFTIIGCDNKSENVNINKIGGNEVLVCNIDDIKETREIKLSELVDSFEVICLENTRDAYIGSVWAQTVSGNHLFFADTQNKLTLFNRSGKFIRKWDSGRGPFEFVIPEYPQIYGDNIFVCDAQRNKLLKYNLADDADKAIDLIKTTGVKIVLNDSLFLTAGNSESENDPYLICIQDFNGKLKKSIPAKNHINIFPKLAQDRVIVHPYKNGWNIHLPFSDTLMFYDFEQNKLTPKAIFYSESFASANKKLMEERLKHGLEISDNESTKSLVVVPEFESDNYYFLSIHKYGQNKDLPWYVSTRKMCMVNKKTREAYYITIIDDFMGDIPFGLQGTNQIWEPYITQDFSAIRYKEKLKRILEEKADKLANETKERIENLMAEISDEDNNIVMYYKLRE